MANILIVDDRPTNREYLRSLLGYGGHQLLEACDGREALDLVRAERPDLVITDILMPAVDGYEFLRRLREDPAIAATPVIFLTAHYHEREARALGEAAGVFRVLAKPVEPETVLEVVAAALRSDPLTTGRVDPSFDPEHLRLITDKLYEKANELRTANGKLQALIDLGLRLGSERDPQFLLQGTCHAAREILGARSAAVGVLDGEGTRVRQFAGSGLEAEAVARLSRIDPRTGCLGTVLTECCSLRLNSYAATSPDPGLSAILATYRGALVTPIISPNRVYGWLCLFDRIDGASFSAEDERIAGILAAQLGRIYENGSLYADLLRHASELEREIGQRRAAETEARRSSALLRAVVENTPDAVFVKDREGRYLLFNPAASRFVGRTVEEVLGKDDTELFDPEGAQLVMERDRRVMQTGVPETDEERLTAAGVTRTYLATKAPFRDEHGEIIGTIGISHDITVRKQAAEALRAAEQRLQRVLASSPAVLLTVSVREGRLHRATWVSENLSELFGHSPEVAQRPGWWQDNVHPEALHSVMSAVHTELFAGGRAACEFRFRHGDGSFRWTREDIRLIRGAEGEPLVAVAAWTDLTEQKSIEAQLQQAQKMEAVGTLAGGIAHDFNNVLAVVVGYSELALVRLPADHPLRRAFEQIHLAGERGAGLTRQLLAFSRQQVISPRPIDLNNIVRELEPMLRRLIGEDVLLSTACTPELGIVRVDPGQVEQVVMNLAVNARDAMPRGGRLSIATSRVQIGEPSGRTRAGMMPGNYACITVSDTGTGMTPEVKARVFDPFFTTKAPGKGTGLGMAVVHGIVTQSNGYIELESEPGVGTRFSIYFRLVDAPLDTAETEATRGVELPLGNETILLAEDEDALRTLLGQVLIECGYRVLQAKDGKHALRLAQSHEGPLHLLVSDVVMPHLAGRELAERLQELRPEMKVLFVSGYTDDAVVRHGVLQAEFAFLQKPFSPVVFARAVRELLDHD